MFGPSDFVGPRSKVDLRCKGYAWAPVLGSFVKLRKVGVFSYLVYFRFKSHLKWFGLYEAVRGRLISPEILGMLVGNLRTVSESPQTVCVACVMLVC